MRTRRESLPSRDQGFRDPNPVSCLGAKIEDMGAPLHWAEQTSVGIIGITRKWIDGLQRWYVFYTYIYIWYGDILYMRIPRHSFRIRVRSKDHCKIGRITLKTIVVQDPEKCWTEHYTFTCIWGATAYSGFCRCRLRRSTICRLSHWVIQWSSTQLRSVFANISLI